MLLQKVVLILLGFLLAPSLIIAQDTFSVPINQQSYKALQLQHRTSGKVRKITLNSRIFYQKKTEETLHYGKLNFISDSTLIIKDQAILLHNIMLIGKYFDGWILAGIAGIGIVLVGIVWTAFGLFFHLFAISTNNNTALLGATIDTSIGKTLIAIGISPWAYKGKKFPLSDWQIDFLPKQQ